MLSAMAPVPLMVGHAEDRAERDADTMADTALGRLRRIEGDTHSHGPGCDHSQVRRSAAPPSGAPVVGYEGGALDTGTSSAIESRRGSGRQLDADVRRRMETAFNTSFSSVRIHDDSHAAKLNSAVSATAFTTGKDIFFGKGAYAPHTAGGDRILAHELAHTLQPAGAAVRTVDPRAHAAIARSITATAPVLRRAGVKDWARKKATAISEWGTRTKVKATVAAGEAADWAGRKKDAAGAWMSEKGDELSAWGTRTFTNPEKTGPYQGDAGRHKPAQFAQDSAKYSGVAGSVGSIMGGTAGSGTAGGGEAVPLLNVIDSAMSGVGGMSQKADAEKYGDLGGVATGNRRIKNAVTGGGQAALGLGKAIGETVLMKQAGLTNTGEAVVKMGGSAGAGAAAGALGVVVGGLQVMHGGYRLVRALQKHAKVKAADVVSTDGKRWQSEMMGVEKVKAAIGGVKIALGTLGIAAGALFLASNPIGWAVGLAAAIAGGVYAGVKIGMKLHETYKIREATKKLAGGVKAEEVEGRLPQPAAEDDLVAAAANKAPARAKPPLPSGPRPQVPGRALPGVPPPPPPRPAAAGVAVPQARPSRPAPAPPVRRAGPAIPQARPTRPAPPPPPRPAAAQAGPVAPAPAPKKGFQRSAQELAFEQQFLSTNPLEAKQRSELLAKTNEAARAAVPAARLAGELIDALKKGDHEIVTAAIQKATETGMPMSLLLDDEADKMLHDAYVLLASIDVEPDVALSESGLDIISRKLSKIDAL
jgi:hypothetical protein